MATQLLPHLRPFFHLGCADCIFLCDLLLHLVYTHSDLRPFHLGYIQHICGILPPVVPAPADGEDLIVFDVGEVPPPQVQHYRQAFQSNVHLVDDVADLDLSQVLPRDTVFTMRDLSHTL